MRAKSRSMLMVTVVALFAIAAAPASAKKGADNGPTWKEPVGGYTCAEKAPSPESSETWAAVTWNDSSHFSFTLKPTEDFTCIDVVAPAGVWNVDVMGSGATQVMLILRDSYQPGDFCAEARMRGDAIYGDWTLPLADDSISELPAATVNACGVEYGEWIDGELVMVEQRDVQNPLSLHAFFRGKVNSDATIQVDLPTP